MKFKFLKVFFASAFTLVTGYSAFTSQQKGVMSDLAMENIEALANGENWGNPNAGKCTGTFYICESNYDQWWNDANRNCSSLEVTLVLIPRC